MQIKYSDHLMQTLTEVNSEINSYQYVTESWDGLVNLSDLRKTKKGTCADYSYTKMLVLVEKGFDSASMGVCSCEVADMDNAPHAVLIVSTTDGDFVLDNRCPAVCGFKEASDSYRWTYIPDYLKGGE